jgi:hypothetical protein
MSLMLQAVKGFSNRLHGAGSACKDWARRSDPAGGNCWIDCGAITTAFGRSATVKQ